MRRYLPALKWVWTLIILAGAVAIFGQVELLGRLGQLSLYTLLAALAVSVIQVFLSAWRWQFTARQLGLALPYSSAVREYYLATFINQVLPGGLLGDASRAMRHGAVTARRAEAVNAVIIERFSGQMVLGLLTILAWTAMPPLKLATSQDGPLMSGYSVWLWMAIVVGACMAAWFWRRPLLRAFKGFCRALWSALFTPRILGIQLMSSGIVVASYVLVFVLLAQGMGVLMSLNILVPCVLLLLASMTIPVTIAGWGVRESLAGLLWVLAGYPADEGLALSLAYGGVFLMSSLPGLALAIPRLRTIA